MRISSFGEGRTSSLLSSLRYELRQAISSCVATPMPLPPIVHPPLGRSLRVARSRARDATRISVAADSRFPPLRRQVVRSNGGAPSSAPPSTTFSFKLATLLRCREPLAASQPKRFEQPVG